MTDEQIKLAIMELVGYSEQNARCAVTHLYCLQLDITELQSAIERLSLIVEQYPDMFSA